MGLPTPAIVFMAVIGGCCLLLLILYQCLKAGMFFKTEPPADSLEEKGGYAELGDTYGTETDDDYVGPSSKATSRRSSFNTSGSKSDGELALGDSASVYGYGKYSDGEYSPSSGRALSAYGEAIDISQEEFLSTAGRLQVSASYAPTAQKLAVTVLRAEDIPTKHRGGAASVQVRVVLLPAKKQRFKTKTKPSTNPNFHETFTFSRVSQSDLQESGLRFRLYGHEKLTRDKLLGELTINVTEFDLEGDGEALWRTLTPRSALSASDSMYDLSDTASVKSHGSYGSVSSLAMAPSGAPELLVSLCYQSLTGRLTVEVLKASNLRNVAMQRAPDSYVKVTLLSSSGKQVAKSKTTIRKSMADPEYNESFIFEISETDLHRVTLSVAVIAISRARKKKEMIGWFSLGKNYSGQEEIRHWNDMIQEKEQNICRWHTLADA
ncbi:PREDICTED: synaptotagmin-16-like isoform X4 [Acropora digitifera]|uniref:synaptotagmin-16-like isoform X4 n=1 Tax=Acropora digitifera TaxID=70779 RepID=UPI00077AC145|nr:PREDICTED: synaptotagmin-16-like isoform X4 [Acropora digitifera]XP_029195397.1 synaptotagmin-16-like isoform X4 [Acropora millepora]